MNGHANTIDVHRVDVESWFFRNPCPGDTAGHVAETVRERFGSGAEEEWLYSFEAAWANSAKGSSKGALGFVYLVEHGVKLRYVAVQYNSN